MFEVNEGDDLELCVDISSAAVERIVILTIATLEATAQGRVCQLKPTLARTFVMLMLYIYFSATAQFPDFTPVNQEMTFNPSTNELIQCIVVQIIDDSVLEATESFEAVLSSSDPDISIRPISNTVVMIRNDDSEIKLTIMSKNPSSMHHTLYRCDCKLSRNIP